MKRLTMGAELVCAILCAQVAAAETWTASCDEGDYDVSFGGGVTIAPHQDQQQPVVNDSKKRPGHPVTHRTFPGAATLLAPKSGGSTAAPHEGGRKG